MNLFRLADRLGQPVFVLEQMTYAEFYEWLAYFRIIKDEK